MDNPARLERLGKLLSEAMGRRVRVVVNAPESAGGRGGGASEDQGDGDSAGPGGGAPEGSTDRRAAMELPLVKDVLDVFSDAHLIDVRDERESDTS